MKILILLLAAMYTYTSYAQEDEAQEEDEFGCVHDVSTNYKAPTNDALPSVIGTQYLNGFDWLPLDGNGMLLGYDLVNMSFQNNPIYAMNSIMSSNLSYYNYIEDGALLLNENGWELLLVNVGYYPDNVTENGNNSNYAVPYIVIYNRYSGVLRVFFNYGSDNVVGEGADAVEIMVSFEEDTKMTGLLRLNEGSDQTLDQHTDVQFVRSHAKAPAQGKNWASTDFQLAYDPCTCFFPSKLKIDFFQTKSSTISLFGRAITLSDEPLINNTNLQTNPNDFLSGYEFDGANQPVGGGLVMHKSLEKMIETYIVKLEEYNEKLIAVGEHNEKVKKNISILKLGLAVIRISINWPVGLIALTAEQIAEKAAEKSAAETLGLTQFEIEKYYLGLAIQNGVDADGWFKVADKFFKGIVKSNNAGKKIINQENLFKAIGAIFGEKGKTFVEQNFVAKKVPPKPAIPTATFTEMTYQGFILDDKKIGGPDFFTPGTYGSNGTGSPTFLEAAEYPIYNEILGPFALLKKPKIKIVENNINYSFAQSVDQQVYNLGSSFDINIYDEKKWTTEYQITLDEELEFAMNPALDITDYEISASFEIVATPKEVPGSNPTPSDVIINAFSMPFSNVNFLSENYDLENFFPIASNGRPFNYYNTEILDPFDYDNELNLPFTEHVADNSEEILRTVLLQTEHIPLDAFTPFTASVGIHHQTAAGRYHWIQESELEDYGHSFDANGQIIWDLNDPNLKPTDLNPGQHGYKYDFEVTLKLLVTMNFGTLNSEGEPNSVTELLTYPIDASQITNTSVGAINNIYYSSSNVLQYEKNLFFGNTPVNLGLGYDYKFYGQPVEGCTLNGTTYTCQAWEDVTIVGDIIIANGYDVNFYGGNEVSVIGGSTVPHTANLEIKAVLDYSIPSPKATYDEVNTFCNNLDPHSPGYLANSAEGKFGEDVDDEVDPALDEFNTEWDFNLFPNPTHSSTTVQLFDAADGKVSVECFDVTMKRINLVESEEGSDRIKLSTENLSPGIYLIKVSTNRGFKTKRLIVH
jgi:hypothetical protein